MRASTFLIMTMKEHWTEKYFRAWILKSINSLMYILTEWKMVCVCVCVFIYRAKIISPFAGFEDYVMYRLTINVEDFDQYSLKKNAGI